MAVEGGVGADVCRYRLDMDKGCALDRPIFCMLVSTIPTLHRIDLSIISKGLVSLTCAYLSYSVLISAEIAHYTRTHAVPTPVNLDSPHGNAAAKSPSLQQYLQAQALEAYLRASPCLPLSSPPHWHAQSPCYTLADAWHRSRRSASQAAGGAT